MASAGIHDWDDMFMTPKRHARSEGEWDQSHDIYLAHIVEKMRPTWQRQAACRDKQDLMFAPNGQRQPEARRLCESCPVLAQCAEWALATELRHGFAGGMSAKARLRIFSDRNKAAAA